jgi:hypothetical protein
LGRESGKGISGKPSQWTVREAIAHLRAFVQPQQEPDGIGVSSGFETRALSS